MIEQGPLLKLHVPSHKLYLQKAKLRLCGENIGKYLSGLLDTERKEFLLKNQKAHILKEHSIFAYIQSKRSIRLSTYHVKPAKTGRFLPITH